MKRAAVGIVGAGNSAHALSAYLSSQGHDVYIYARRPEAISYLAEQRSITATGKVEGRFPIAAVTDSPARLAAACDTIFVATVTTAYPDVAAALAPFLTANHAVVLFSGKLCGSLEFGRALDVHGGLDVPVIETDSLFACRVQEDGSIWIRGFKGWTLYSCPRVSHTREYGALVQSYFPGLDPACNLVQRGLTDFGAVAHAVVSVANISRIDRQDPFLFYYEGLSERTVALLETMENEFRTIGAAYTAPIVEMKELLNRYYGCNTESLLAAMTSVPNYRHSLAPTTLNHRYLQEDVACTLVPLQGLARKAGVATPMIDSVINLTSILGQQDFVRTGRSLSKLGLSDLSREEIVAWLES